MIPAHSSSVNGAVLKIRKTVPRLDFSSRAISATSFPAAYSSITRMCRREIRPRFAFRLFRRRAFPTGGMIDLITLNATPPSFSASLRRPTLNDASYSSSRPPGRKVDFSWLSVVFHFHHPGLYADCRRTS
jgi:hypothetical protein